MHRISAFLAAAPLLVSVAVQSPADFSGTWVVEPTTRAAGVAKGSAPPALSAQGDMGSGWPAEITITQDASSLMVVYTYFHPRDVQPPFTFRYPLNGSVARHMVNMGRGPHEQLSQAQWRGAALVIETTIRYLKVTGGEPLIGSMSQALSLESPDTLIVETTRPGVADGAPSTTRTVYRKRKP